MKFKFKIDGHDFLVSNVIDTSERVMIFRKGSAVSIFLSEIEQGAIEDDQYFKEVERELSKHLDLYKKALVKARKFLILE